MRMQVFSLCISGLLAKAIASSGRKAARAGSVGIGTFCFQPVKAIVEHGRWPMESNVVLFSWDDCPGYDEYRRWRKDNRQPICLAPQQTTH